MENNNIVELSIEDLLNGDNQYVIPPYQRNYAWGEEQITQLIQDIIDYFPKDSETKKNYYIGTLIVYERRHNNTIIYETIDGQQRLTTLSILSSVIKNKTEYSINWFKKLNLVFDSRKNSTETLQAVYDDHFPSNQEYSIGIKDAYELVDKVLKIKLAEYNLTIDRFAEFLYKNVKILRVPVPNDTDLNHYFEIMNSRGEQLEKHEVLKAKLLEVFNSISNTEEKEKSKNLFNQIWEACSNMEKYVQYGFSISQRNSVFGQNDWNQFSHKNFDDLNSKISFDSKTSSESIEELSIDEIISGRTYKSENQELEDSPDRFTSVINFQNFLLHVLRVQTKKDIPLDDKRLLEIFKTNLEECKDEESKINFSKNFAFNLIKCKFLFDKYIIKREFIGGIDKWSLKRFKWYDKNKVSYVNTFSIEENEHDLDDNRKTLMLLSMYHVSVPTMVYKHWLNAALYFLFYEEKISAANYIKYLETTVKSFVFNRFLSHNPMDYYPIIFEYENIQNPDWDTQIDESKLNFGIISNNLIFNYVDYLLWKQKAPIDSKIKAFEFSARSSVEHYYPQNPMEGFPRMENKKVLNCFGNLCLISHSKNSRLSNFSPSNKKEFYLKSMDSVKQYIMMDDLIKEWNEDAIIKHNNEIIELLKEQLINNN